jgi:hypothetical protein
VPARPAGSFQEEAMALITCPECKAEISDKAAACVRCGAPITQQRPSQAFDRPNTPPPPPHSTRRIWPWFVAAPILAFFAFGFYASNTPEGKARAQARQGIETCWDEQKRKSFSPGEQRFIAGACERMEADFRQRYGASP